MTKKIAFFLFLSLPLLAKNPFFKLLPFKEAIVEYSIMGNKKGFQTLYIKDYGEKRVYYKNIKASFLSKKKEKRRVYHRN